MKKKQSLLWTAAALASLTLFACVTINIYFPAEKVESAAEDIVNDIRGIKPPPEKLESGIHQKIAHAILFAVSPASAWAADEETTVSNPTIRALREKMKARFSLLTPYYQNGALKEGENGYLSVADAASLNLKEKRDLNSLVDAENKDRTTLYGEVAKALKIEPSQIEKIAAIFAKEWQKPVR
jgi:uncharacterized protein YdbL (DUF1318 family)